MVEAWDDDFAVAVLSTRSFNNDAIHGRICPLRVKMRSVVMMLDGDVILPPLTIGRSGSAGLGHHLEYRGINDLPHPSENQQN